jgi:hypothetical protein
MLGSEIARVRVRLRLFQHEILHIPGGNNVTFLT